MLKDANIAVVVMVVDLGVSFNYWTCTVSFGIIYDVVSDELV